MSGAIKRMQGEKFADFAARQRAAQEAERAVAYKPKRRRSAKTDHAPRDEDNWRDDLGESPDY